MRETGRNILAIFLLLSIAYSIALSGWTYIKINEYSKPLVIGKVSSGRIELCINEPPTIDTNTCPNNATQDVMYSCRMNATDPDSSTVIFSQTKVSVTRNFSNLTSLPFNITLSGNITFTPTNEEVGEYYMYINGLDNSGCGNAFSFVPFSLTVLNVNDPPYLIKNISDVSFNEGQTLYSFFLNNHFADPDNDNLTYVVSGNTNITVEILPDSQVIFKAINCGVNDLMIFTAIDPFNLTGDSNAVRVTCIKKAQPQPPSTGSGGGGGGGGGGSVIPCKSQFECYEYHKCNITNQKVHNCVDKKGCADDELITLPCFYEEVKKCNETWSCSEWGLCMPNMTQTRICTDTSLCSTNFTKPNETQPCEYIGTCTDGIKNCHDGSCEEAIDCGGSCEACKSIQVPYPFKEERGLGIYILTGILMILLTTTLIYHYFKKEINALIAKAGWYLTKKRRKQILLSKEDQKKLMAEIQGMEKKLNTSSKKEELYEVVNKYSESLRYYFLKVIKIQPDFDEAQFNSALQKNSKIIPVLRRIFKSQFADYIKVSKTESLVTKYKLLLLIDEIRNIVLQTSEYNVGEYPRDVQEFKPSEKDNLVQKLQIKIINTYIALQFVEIEVAKKKYLEISSDYEKLSIPEAEFVFEDIRRLYDNTIYVNGWAWREKK